MYAWEKSFSEIVNDLRTAELRCVKIQAYINAGIGLAWYNSKYLVGTIAVCLANQRLAHQGRYTRTKRNSRNERNMGFFFVPFCRLVNLAGGVCGARVGDPGLPLGPAPQTP